MPIASDTLAKITLAPLLLGQAIYVRRRALILPEPPGPRSGTLGNGPPLRLLIAGDSSGAGVGAPNQQTALSGRLARTLAPHNHLTWRLEAATGATTATTLANLRALHTATPQHFDVAVLALGVNDVTRSIPLSRWITQQNALHDLLLTHYGIKKILISGLPPMGQFPLLPQPLRGILGRTATRFDTALAALCAANPALIHLPFDLPFRPDYIAADGFHPSEPAYALWAEMIATAIARP